MQSAKTFAVHTKTFAVHRDFKFQTTSSHGVQVLAGRTDGVLDHIALELRGGAEVFDTSTGENPVIATSAPGLSDDAWHTVTGIRSGSLQSRLQVDGATTESTYTDDGVGPGRLITTDGTLYVGGHPTTVQDNTAMGLVSQGNFIGCMGPVHYEQLFEMSDTDSASGTVVPGACGPAPGMFVAGDGDLYEDCASCCADDSGACRHCMCYDAMGVGEHDGAGSDNAQNSGSFDGNTFLTFETGVNPAGHSFVLTFSIKTSATDAIVLASSNGAECRGAEWCQSDFTHNDHLVLQVVGGKLQLAFGMGSDCQMPQYGGLACENNVMVESASAVNDNAWHVVRASRSGAQMAALTVDGVTTEASGTGPNRNIDLTGNLYIGGHPEPSAFERGLTATRSFAGCLSDFYYEVDFDMPEHHCGQGAKTYDGQTFDTYDANHPGLDLGGNTFSFSFSFKTVNADGLIFVAGLPPNLAQTTGRDDYQDHVVLEVLQGHLHFDFSTGGLDCNVNVVSAARVDDGHWHTVTARRLEDNAGNAGSLRVDGVDATAQAMDPSCSMHGIDIRENPIYVGGRPVLRNSNNGWDRNQDHFCDATLAARTGCSYQQTTAVTGAVDAVSNFAGCLSGIRVDQTQRQGQPQGQCADPQYDNAGEFTGDSFGQMSPTAVNPGGLMFAFSFSFKTSADGALIVAHGNGGNADQSVMTDHIVVEIVNGKVRFELDAGTDAGDPNNCPDLRFCQGQKSTCVVESSIVVTDNEWHHVLATRTGPLLCALSVDSATTRGAGDGHFISVDINLPPYIGGHPSFENAPGLQSTSNFIGCMTDVRYTLDFGAARHVSSLDGHYEVVPQAMPYQAARQYCQTNNYDLASLHSSQEQQLAADQCAKFTQRQRAATTNDCGHHLANGDVNSASSTWISNSEEFEYVGCFIADAWADPNAPASADPWPDAASLGQAAPTGNCDPTTEECLAYGQTVPGVKLLNWDRCRQAARAAGYSTFAMENPGGREGGTQFTAPFGYAQCQHMDILAHGNYHDGGHNGQGRAPDSDCAAAVDAEGHLLGGQWRVALYATSSTAQCLHDSIGEADFGNVHNVDECSAGSGGVPEDYVPNLGDGDSGDGGDRWMLVGCFVSDQDGHSHLDPWSDGQRYFGATWFDCRQKAVDEGSSVFIMEYGQGYDDPGMASCGHMNVVNHGNFHTSTASDAQHFINTMGYNHPGDTGHNGYGRAPIADCLGEIDEDGHALGGPWRFALYAQHHVAVCLNDFHIGETHPHGCWIGFADEDVGAAGVAADDMQRFTWGDGSPVNYAHWSAEAPVSFCLSRAECAAVYAGRQASPTAALPTKDLSRWTCAVGSMPWRTPLP